MRPDRKNKGDGSDIPDRVLRTTKFTELLTEPITKYGQTRIKPNLFFYFITVLCFLNVNIFFFFLRNITMTLWTPTIHQYYVTFHYFAPVK